MKLITAWERWNIKDKMWEHNHIEDGYVPHDIPMPAFYEQGKAWKGGQWRKFFGYQDFYNVIHLCNKPLEAE